MFKYGSDIFNEKWNKWLDRLQQLKVVASSTSDILVYIGIREAGWPVKVYDESKQADLRRMAVCVLLVPARYYELLWVDDTGWPHYRELQRLPEMSEGEKDQMLREYILFYAEKNRLI